MTIKKMQVQIFMTVIDEAVFSAQVKAMHPRVLFIDPATWATNSAPVARSSIDVCVSTFVLLLNEDLMSLDDYGNKFFRPHPSRVGYSGATTGPGLIQFGRCRNPVYDKYSLGSESISVGYDSSDERMDRYVKSVMNIVKKGGTKVYYIDPATGVAFDKHMPGYWAWPDAAKVYDGSEGHYLRPDAINRMVAK